MNAWHALSAPTALENRPTAKPMIAAPRRNGYLLSETMRNFDWSKSEKKVASAAFKLALTRELKAIRREAEAMLQDANDDEAVWRLHDYLSLKRREVTQKYDYRYSVLIFVFGRLLSEGWLAESDLSGIGEEKMSAIKLMISLR